MATVPPKGVTLRARPDQVAKERGQHPQPRPAAGRRGETGRVRPAGGCGAGPPEPRAMRNGPFGRRRVIPHGRPLAFGTCGPSHPPARLGQSEGDRGTPKVEGRKAAGKPGNQIVCRS